VTKPVPHLAPIHLVITYADAIELDRLIAQRCDECRAHDEPEETPA